MNAVSVAEPRVWNQLVSPGTLRKRKYLIPPTSPERSSIQSTGYRIVCWICSLRVSRRVAMVFLRSVGRLDGIEPGLETVHVLAREGERPLVDHGRRADAVDVRDRERLADEEVAVADREGVAVERAYRRTGDPVPLGVVLAAVARTAEAGDRHGRDQGHIAERLRVLLVQRTVRLHRAAEVRTVVRDDREARLAVQLAVVADERRPPRHLALRRVCHVRRD